MGDSASPRSQELKREPSIMGDRPIGNLAGSQPNQWKMHQMSTAIPRIHRRPQMTVTLVGVGSHISDITKGAKNGWVKLYII